AKHLTDLSSTDGFTKFNAKVSKIGSDTISTGGGKALVFGDMAVISPQVMTTPTLGLWGTLVALPVDEPGTSLPTNFNYVFGFGTFGALHQWKSNGSGSAVIDADTITGGAGVSVLFGELGNDTIKGGTGAE